MDHVIKHMTLEKLQAYSYSLPSAEMSDSQALTPCASDDSSELESEQTEDTLTYTLFCVLMKLFLDFQCEHIGLLLESIIG